MLIIFLFFQFLLWCIAPEIVIAEIIAVVAFVIYFVYKGETGLRKNGYYNRLKGKGK